MIFVPGPNGKPRCVTWSPLRISFTLDSIFAEVVVGLASLVGVASLVSLAEPLGRVRTTESKCAGLMMGREERGGGIDWDGKKGSTHR
jgi:hypothetical protein